MARPTVKDVARHAGVSQGVVSRVVNVGSGSVSSATRDRVLASIAALGYRPHRGARDLKNASTRTIGLVLADVGNEFYANLADRLVGLARDRGLGVLLMTTQEAPEGERASLDLLMEQRVAGVIGAPAGDDPTAWNQALAFGVKLVFIDRSLSSVPGASVVGVDNHHAAELATRHLIDLGHRHVALIGGPLSTSTGQQRLAGYRAALSSAGLDYDERLVYVVPFRGGAGTEAVDQLMDLPRPPTGLVVGNTAAALGIVAALHKRRTLVPRDLSVVIFHDLSWTSVVEPGFTVIRHDMDAMAEHALSQLLRLLDEDLREDEPLPDVKISRSQLVIRGSSGPPPSAASVDENESVRAQPFASPPRPQGDT